MQVVVPHQPTFNGKQFQLTHSVALTLITLREKGAPLRPPHCSCPTCLPSAGGAKAKPQQATQQQEEGPVAGSSAQATKPLFTSLLAARNCLLKPLRGLPALAGCSSCPPTFVERDFSKNESRRKWTADRFGLFTHHTRLAN